MEMNLCSMAATLIFMYVCFLCAINYKYIGKHNLKNADDGKTINKLGEGDILYAVYWNENKKKFLYYPYIISSIKYSFDTNIKVKSMYIEINRLYFKGYFESRFGIELPLCNVNEMFEKQYHHYDRYYCTSYEHALKLVDDLTSKKKITDKNKLIEIVNFKQKTEK